MGFISRMISAFMHTNGILAFVFIILSAVVWFLGPLLALGDGRPFETVMQRVITIAIMFAVTLMLMLFLALLRARRNNNLNIFKYYKKYLIL